MPASKEESGRAPHVAAARLSVGIENAVDELERRVIDRYLVRRRRWRRLPPLILLAMEVVEVEHRRYEALHHQPLERLDLAGAAEPEDLALLDDDVGRDASAAELADKRDDVRRHRIGLIEHIADPLRRFGDTCHPAMVMQHEDGACRGIGNADAIYVLLRRKGTILGILKGRYWAIGRLAGLEIDDRAAIEAGSVTYAHFNVRRAEIALLDMLGANRARGQIYGAGTAFTTNTAVP